MRLFNPDTLTEVIPGFHDTTGAIELPDDSWFFTMKDIPIGKILSVDSQGMPFLADNVDDNG
ncbi:hypothetical protein KQJ14_18740 [Enterobacteriaceae bacterium S32_ASV_15]|nr:hypothetical protein [Enterobacteriaceae bacterium S32_ASV_15]